MSAPLPPSFESDIVRLTHLGLDRNTIADTLRCSVKSVRRYQNRAGIKGNPGRPKMTMARNPDEHTVSEWSHEPQPVKPSAKRQALIDADPLPLHYRPGVVLELQAGELWCVKCGENWPAGTTCCTRCGGRKFVEAADVLRDGEWR